MRRDDLPESNSGWQVIDSSSIQYDESKEIILSFEKKIRCFFI